MIIISGNSGVLAGRVKDVNHKLGTREIQTFKGVDSFLFARCDLNGEVIFIDGNYVFDFYSVISKLKNDSFKIVAIIPLDSLFCLEFCLLNNVNAIISENNLSHRNISYAIDEILNDGFYCDYYVTKAFFNSFYPVHKERSPLNENLNYKEQTVLNHLIRGLTYSKIASQMNVSINTVRYYTKSIYRKLDVTSRYEATLKVR